MFNFFKKNKDNEEELNSVEEYEETTAITYYLDQEGKVIVDVSMPEYDIDSVTKLAKIVETLSNQKCFIQTVEMIRKGLMETEHEDLLVHFLIGLGIPEGNLKTAKNGPCIQPSDLLK
tara:strand:- start:2251 stop:2604 length:354 start_codon:yes stop_codon:yes gene_type:complete